MTDIPRLPVWPLRGGQTPFKREKHSTIWLESMTCNADVASWSRRTRGPHTEIHGDTLGEAVLFVSKCLSESVGSRSYMRF